MFPASPSSRQCYGLITGTFWSWEYLPLPLRDLSSPRKASQALNTSARQLPLPSAICLESAKALRVTDCPELLPAPPQLVPGIIILISPLILERQTPFWIRVVQVSLSSFVGDNGWDTPLPRQNISLPDFHLVHATC